MFKGPLVGGNSTNTNNLNNSNNNSAVPKRNNSFPLNSGPEYNDDDGNKQKQLAGLGFLLIDFLLFQTKITITRLMIKAVTLR